MDTQEPQIHRPTVNYTPINPCIVQGSTVLFLRKQKNLPDNWNIDKDKSGNPEIKTFLT